MTVVAFNFTKILAEKNKAVKGKIDIKNNVKILKVEESKLSVDSKRTTLKFGFKYLSGIYNEFDDFFALNKSYIILPNFKEIIFKLFNILASWLVKTNDSRD